MLYNCRGESVKDTLFRWQRSSRYNKGYLGNKVPEIEDAVYLGEQGWIYGGVQPNIYAIALGVSYMYVWKYKASNNLSCITDLKKSCWQNLLFLNISKQIIIKGIIN